MSTIAKAPTLTREELADVRWLAREVLADESEEYEPPGGGGSALSDCIRRIKRARAVLERVA
jgi:hypothetical protein